jgi:hypothetical protein
MSHKRIFKEFDSDLKVQEEMNLSFIKSLPQTSAYSIKELGRETKEFAIPEFIPKSKIDRMEKELRMRKP